MIILHEIHEVGSENMKLSFLSIGWENLVSQKINQILEIYCYSSHFHNIDLLKQELAIKQNHIMNNPSDYIVWKPKIVLGAQLEEKFIEQEIHRA